ncbi:MAG: polysaccharide deacetylase family protein [Puniceicoccales bacterium]
MSEVIERVETDAPLVALTFDDGPNGEVMEQMLETLAEQDARATFFVLGKNVLAEPDLARKTLARGHELANHSKTHPHLPKLSRAEMVAEIDETQRIIEETVGVKPVIFRAPYLDMDSELLGVLAEYNLPAVNASKGTKDWAKETTVQDIIDRSLDGVKPGDIILMHSWSVKTRDALPAVLEGLKERGLRSVTVSELIASASQNNESMVAE